MDDSRSAHSRVATPFVGFLLVGALTGILWVVVAVLGTTPASAVPARPVVTRFSQPDGSAFRARLYGDEWTNGYETMRGYTVVKNKKSGFWEYAVRRDGKLVPGGVAAGRVAPSGLRRHLRETLTGRLAATARAHGGFEESDTPNVGTQPSLVLLVDYDNQVGATTEADWATTFFGVSGSVNDYYDEVSYGNLDLPAAAETFGTVNNGVVGWLRIGTTHPNLEANFGPGGHRAITKAAILASDPYVDYAAFDSNANGSIQRNELHITVIVAGHETSYGGSLNSCGNSIWGHNWALFGGEVPTVDGKQVGSDAAGGGYNQFGERHCWSGDPGNDHMATIGIMVHEMGHDLNLPDLYDTDGGSEGVGEWSVMAGGAWTFTGSNHEGSSPVHPDAFSKWYEGWLTPLQITDSQSVSLTQMATNDDVIQLLDNPGTPRPIDWTFQQNSGTGEYFLVENRQLSGYDAGLPGCGLLIWHIDETRTASNLANADEARKLVDLEEADGLNHLDNQFNRGDNGDPYRGPSVFDAASNPNSNLYSGAPSQVAVTNVSSSCATTMTADMSVGSPSSVELNVSKSGTGTGTVTSSPAGINCGPDCSEEYSQGTDVTLTATPTGGSRFAGWSGACSGTGTCLIDMVGPRSVTASFIGPTTTSLSVTKTSTKVKAKGNVLPAHPGEDVRVTLYKKRSNGTWRKITTKTDSLNNASAYVATFTRPSAGKCKITSVFASDGDHLGSKATKQFRC